VDRKRDEVTRGVGSEREMVWELAQAIPDAGDVRRGPWYRRKLVARLLNSCNGTLHIRSGLLRGRPESGYFVWINLNMIEQDVLGLC
jgi:hypothetical protein